MKNALLFFLLIIVFLKVNATIYTVCNLPNSGAQFNQIDPAIAAATNGDTIYVMGSSSDYANCTITKNIRLIGPGTFAQKDNAWPATVPSITLGTNLDGVSVLGFSCSIYATDNLQNIDIGYNNIFGGVYPIYFYYSDNVSNLHIYSNIISPATANTSINFSSPTFFNNVTIENNIIRGGLSGLVAGNVLLNHNVFYNSPYIGNAAFSGLANAVINNNIFYNSDPLAGTTGCSFGNNITYSSSTVYSNLQANNGNIDNTDPLMINVANTGGYLPTQNFSLQVNSQALNSANDGTNIGITGGINMNTVTGEVYNMPVIRKMEILNTNVPQNGNINVKVRSTKSRTN